jgi:hypothetical protein
MVDFRCECQMSMCCPAILKRSAAGQPLEIRRENQCRNHEANSVRHLRVLARSQSLSGILHACLPRAKSITLAQTGWKYEGGNRVWLFGRCYRFHQSREIVGIIKTLTTKRSPTGRMEVMFSCLCEEEPVVRSKTGHTAAFDFGLTQFLTGHNGHDIPAPLPLRHSLRQVRKANRALSRTLPGSAIGNKPDTRWQRCTGALPTSGRPGIGTLPMRCVSSMTRSIWKTWNCGVWPHCGDAKSPIWASGALCRSCTRLPPSSGPTSIISTAFSRPPNCVMSAAPSMPSLHCGIGYGPVRVAPSISGTAMLLAIFTGKGRLPMPKVAVRPLRWLRPPEGRIPQGFARGSTSTDLSG